MERDIAVVPLVQRHEAQQVRRRFRSGGRAFAGPEEGGEVVGFIADCAFTQVKALGGDFVLEEATGEFKVGVGNGTWMVGRGELLLDVQREGKAPQHWWWCGAGDRQLERVAGGGVGHGEQHASGTGFGGVVGSMDGWLQRNEFSQACGASLEVMVYTGKIGQDLVQVR